MKCKICGNENIGIAYRGIVRDGGLGQYTKEEVTMWQCSECGVIWHEPIQEVKDYYESEEYRQSLEGSSEEETFYRLHDKETYDKFTYTGTTIFRNKTIADIGCGAGAFLDFLKGVAADIIAVEPSQTYRKIMERKGFFTYAYAKDAFDKWMGKIDVITSFDVIEHVEDPITFLKECYQLLSTEGEAIIGTPTDAPVMRSLLGELYERQQLFSTQHLWVFSEKNLKMMAEDVGFKEVSVKYFQRYGVCNLLGWLREKRPNGDLHEEWISDALDRVWKAEAESQGMADYIVLYVNKGGET